MRCTEGLFIAAEEKLLALIGMVDGGPIEDEAFIEGRTGRICWPTE